MTILLTVAALAAFTVPTEPDMFQGQSVKTTLNSRGSGMPNTVVTRKDGKVCKSILITGSRLGATPVCKSQKEWDELSSQFRRTIERGQLTTFKWSPAGGSAPQ